MILRQLFDAASCSYTYLIAGSGGEAVLIDPVREHVDRYVRLLEELELRLVTAIDTHLHADRYAGLAALREHTGCVAAMSERTACEVVSLRLADGETVTVGALRLRALATPGHTPDSMCFVLDDLVFTGDTLLIRGTGRTDLPGGDAGAQYDSIFDRLLTLPEATRVYPAHDYNGATVSTIGEERRHNPRLQVHSRTDYVALMARLKLPKPALMDEAVPANLGVPVPPPDTASWRSTMKHAVLIAALAALPLAAHATNDPPQLRTLAGNCANCHGTTGRGSGAMPRLAGMAEVYFVEQMRQFRDGKRPATVMHQLAKGYSDEEIALLAEFFARQPQ
jgi:glyoxylase-like metal-dependent hydrolase (beta-lactamase superfamily II)